MGLLDKFKKKSTVKNAEENKEMQDIGWEAITVAFEKVYPNQENPKHYASLIKWRLGGNDPLDGISIYDGGDYWHFVTYGLSELYEKESDNKEISGYGMEFTFKLKKDNYENEELEIKCVCGILQSLSRITFTKGEVFKSFEYVYTGQTEGIDSKQKSNITGFITIPDSTVDSIETKNGKVDFVEFIGVTDAEIKAVHNKTLTVAELYERLKTDVTSYNRQSVI